MTTTIYDKTPSQRIADLQQDNEQLYFLMGAISDAVENLGPLPKQQFINTLAAKADRCEPDQAALLWGVIEGLGAPNTSGRSS